MNFKYTIEFTYKAVGKGETIAEAEADALAYIAEAAERGVLCSVNSWLIEENGADNGNR